MPEQLCLLPTIDTSSIMLPNGSWRLTMVVVFPWEGNYSSWLDQKQKKLHKQNKARGKQRTLAKELEWIQMGTKSVPFEIKRV